MSSNDSLTRSVNGIPTGAGQRKSTAYNNRGQTMISSNVRYVRTPIHGLFPFAFTMRSNNSVDPEHAAALRPERCAGAVPRRNSDVCRSNPTLGLRKTPWPLIAHGVTNPSVCL